MRRVRHISAFLEGPRARSGTSCKSRQRETEVRTCTHVVNIPLLILVGRHA